jgi:hypothetical protein
MASYTRSLLEPLHARLEAQAERIGRLENALEQARAEVARERAERERWETALAEAEAADAVEPAPPRRPWWQFWRTLEAPAARSGSPAPEPS